MKKKIKNSKGITLVALVITIVIIIILATVSISAVFGDSGLIKKAQEAKDMTANSIIKEQEEMNKLLAEYDNIMNEDSNIPEPEIPYIDSELAVEPTLSDGMIPVKWNGTNWVKTTKTDSEWYDYANKEWANIVLGDATFITSGSDEILDESKDYSMLVWIPRYAYQIASGYHQSGEEINPSDGTTGAGTINVVFIDKNNQNKDKTKTYSETYPSYATGSGMTDYVVHPAFNFGEKKLAGIWVGKYETSNSDCTTDKATGEYDGTDKKVTIKAGVTSWRNITISNAFTVGINLNNEGNPYGINTNDNIVDPHMMKNTEWGAVAYLSKSKYGKETEEVWINPNSNCITGQAGDSVSASSTTSTNSYNTTNGMKASTTGNVTGVYDMSGGAWEHVAAYLNNDSSSLNTYGSTIVEANAKYKDIYDIGNDDTNANNYAVSIPSNGKYGEAIYETSSSVIEPYKYSWYLRYSDFMEKTDSFLARGTRYDSSSNAGVFSFYGNYGDCFEFQSFRIVINI